MREILQRAWVWFLTVFGISLTIVLFLFQARVSFLSLSAGYVVLNTILAVLIALGATLILVLVPLLCWRYLPQISRTLLVSIALRTVSQALSQYNQPLTAIGIGQREGSVVVSLQSGANDGVIEGMRFSVTNTATGEVWGIIEAVEVDDASCICLVFDRIIPEFWDNLETRMRSDPSPPQGVTFSREIPDEVLTFVAQLLRSWGGR